MMSTVESPVEASVADVDNEPFYLTATFWKRFSVFMSIGLSAASLILSAIASLKKESADMLKTLTVAGVVVNSVSIALSALTSLDWQSKTTHERKFAQQLIKVTHVHDGANVVVTADKKLV